MEANQPVSECPECGAPIAPGAPHGLCPGCLLAEAAAETEMPSRPEGMGSAPSLDALAAAFPSLDILEPIGSGGMGSVFKARQKRLDRLVALKLLRCAPENEPAFARRFLREARAMARLNHPNIVTIHEFGESHGFYYLLMEFVDGVNLRQAMAAGQLLPEDALEIVPRICDALQYAHQQGVLHRDIKPANILLDKTGGVKVADFGLAKFVSNLEDDHVLTRTEASLGTPAYMAPEQFERPGSVDHRADIYSLGVVFYEMLTGELPLGRFPPPSGKSHLDPGIDRVVLRTLEREPNARYQSAGDVRSDLTRLSEGGEGPPDPAPHPGGPPARDLGSWKGIAGATLALLSIPALLFVITRFAMVPIGRDQWEAGIGLADVAAISLVILAGFFTILIGMSALRAIREDRGQVGGLAVALIAALSWPIVLAATAAAAVLEKFAGHNLSRGTITGVSLLVAAAAGWAMVRRARRWALNSPAGERDRRGRWIFAATAVLCALLVFAGWHDDRSGERSPLVSAAISRDTAALAKMLERGAYPDQRSEAGDTALMWLAKHGDTAGIDLFLRRDADINAKNILGHTPLTLACSEGHAGAVATLLSNGAGPEERLPNGANALHLAAHAGHARILTLLLAHGMAVDARNNDGQTPLMLAADGGHLEAAEVLMAAKATVATSDKAGRTALAMAATRGNVRLMEILLKAGAGIDAKDASEQSPLALAVAAGHAPAIDWLVRQGAAETPNWRLMQAFQASASGRWTDAVADLQKAEALLADPGALVFCREGWIYTCDQPAFAVPALLVEAAMRAGDTELARSTARRCLAALPQGPATPNRLRIISRRTEQGGSVHTELLTLSARDVDAPVRNGTGDSLVNVIVESRSARVSSASAGMSRSLFR